MNVGLSFKHGQIKQELEWSSLTGNDYKMLVQQLTEKLLFLINNDTHDEVCNLWREFYAIHRFITKGASAWSDNGKLFGRILNWTKHFKVLAEKEGLDMIKSLHTCIVCFIIS